MNLLSLLAERDRELEGPPQLEERLILAFRARKRRRAIRWGLLGAAAIFAVSLLPVSRWMRPAGSHMAVTPSRLPAMVAEVERTRPVKVEPKLVMPSRPPRRMMAKQEVRREEVQREKVRREVDTEFFPLAEAAPPFERGQIWRLEVPASTMRTVGLPVREEHLTDRIQADVLVGEEGMIRAIRFVRFEVR